MRSFALIYKDIPYKMYHKKQIIDAAYSASYDFMNLMIRDGIYMVHDKYYRFKIKELTDGYDKKIYFFHCRRRNNLGTGEEYRGNKIMTLYYKSQNYTEIKKCLIPKMLLKLCTDYINSCKKYFTEKDLNLLNRDERKLLN